MNVEEKKNRFGIDDESGSGNTIENRVEKGNKITIMINIKHQTTKIDEHTHQICCARAFNVVIVVENVLMHERQRERERERDIDREKTQQEQNVEMFVCLYILMVAAAFIFYYTNLLNN